MSLATGKATFKTTLKNYLEQLSNNEDPDKVGTIDEFVGVLADATETWVKEATFTLPTGSIQVEGTSSAQQNTSPIVLDNITS